MLLWIISPWSTLTFDSVQVATVMPYVCILSGGLQTDNLPCKGYTCAAYILFPPYTHLKRPFQLTLYVYRRKISVWYNYNNTDCLTPQNCLGNICVIENLSRICFGTHIHSHAHVRTHARTHTHTRARAHTHTHARTHTHTFECNAHTHKQLRENKQITIKSSFLYCVCMYSCFL